ESMNSETGKKVVALVVVASDRGLCGAYNSSILRFAWKRKQELDKEADTEVNLYFVGRRANDFFTKRKMPGQYFKDVWVGKFTTQKSDQLSKYFVEEFLAGRINRVEVCYTEFKSAISQEPKNKKLL